MTTGTHFPEEHLTQSISRDQYKEQEERLQDILNASLYKFSEVLRGVLEVELPKIIKLNCCADNSCTAMKDDNSLEKEGIDTLSEIVVDILQETFKNLSEL